ncbi:MAG: hypothetical protein C0405_13370, partial [Desulfovibrio sp.]|nr:hypothetical protein [Desulfovibrio sp.]
MTLSALADRAAHHASQILRAAQALGIGSRKTMIPLGIVALLLALSAVTVQTGYQHTQRIADAYFQSLLDQMEAISELKKSELVQWRKERIGDAKALQGNPILAQAAESLLLHRDDKAARQAVAKWLRLNHRAYGEYDSIRLVDASGQTVVTTTSQAEAASESFRDMLQAGKTDHGARILDLYRDEHDGQVYCAVVYAIFDQARGGEAIGFVALHVRADAYISPLIRKWPASSKTGETLLVSRKGQLVRDLNSLDQADNTGQGFTMPVERLDVVAVRAARGQHGIVRGLDFQGVPVVAALTSLPDSSWSLVTKIDQSEIESDTSDQVWTIRLLVTALAVSLVIGSLTIWKLHRSIVTRNALEAENRLSRSEVQFRNLIETMTQGLVKIDSFGAVTYIN